MPHFTLQLSQEGPMVNAFAGVSQPRRDALAAANLSVPSLVRMRALLDTGASCTCVDESILRNSLSLTPSGQTLVNTPSSGSAPVARDLYDVSLYIPGGSATDPPLIITTLAVVCTDLLIPQGFHALIGRDVLGQCIFSYNGAMGTFTLAY